MPTYTTADIRNIALVGHANAGKTSLVEAMLFKAGAIHHVGEVDKGTTVSDYTDEEKHHRHSLQLSVMHADHQGRRINIVDTPGYPDFVGHAIAALPAVETVVVVLNAAAGIESNARRMMEFAKQRKLCRMIVINRIDAENADLERLVEQIQEIWGKECLPINLPANNGTAVVDVFRKAEGKADFGDVEAAHTAIVDQVVEVDEQLMAIYLEQGEVAPEQLHDPFVKALREGHLVPICFTRARKSDNPEASVGVDALLDIIATLAPSPLEGNPRPFIMGDAANNGHEIHAEPDPNKSVLAHVFSVNIDPFVGKLGIFRIHQGTITRDSQLFVGEGRKPFRISHLLSLQGKEHKEIDAGIPGDICAVAKIDAIHFDSVLHSSHDLDHVRLKPLAFPQPMYGLAITAKSRGDEQKIADALAKLDEEDPTFRITRDAVTHETVIHGLGELHLRIILEKLRNRYKVDVETRPPKIAYRETITAPAEGHHRHKKQTGGAGQFGEVFLRVEPLERDAGFEFVNDVFGGAIPSQFIPAVEKGVRQVLATGAIAGYPLQDVRVSVYDGKHHPVDSKEVAFITAGKRAFLDAISKAKPVILEPIVNMEITIPAANMGDITGDISGKRGRIVGTEMLPGDMAVVKAQVPLAEVMNYQNQLKSVTGGQGSYTMELSHYEPVPAHIQQQITAQYKPGAEED